MQLQGLPAEQGKQQLPGSIQAVPFHQPFNPYEDGRFPLQGFNSILYKSEHIDVLSVLSMPPLVLTLQDVYLSDNRSLDLCDITYFGSCDWDKTYDAEMTPHIMQSDFFRAKMAKQSR